MTASPQENKKERYTLEMALLVIIVVIIVIMTLRRQRDLLISIAVLVRPSTSSPPIAPRIVGVFLFRRDRFACWDDWLGDMEHLDCSLVVERRGEERRGGGEG